MRFRERDNTALVFSVMALLCAAWVVSSHRVNPSPALHFVCFTEEDGRHFAVIELSNPTHKPIFFNGFNGDDDLCPQRWYERRTRGGWIRTGWDWCGTGMELHELAPEGSIKFQMSCCPDEHWQRSLVTGQPHESAPAIRTGIRYGLTPDEQEHPLWTDAIEFNDPPPEAIGRTAPHFAPTDRRWIFLVSGLSQLGCGYLFGPNQTINLTRSRG